MNKHLVEVRQMKNWIPKQLQANGIDQATQKKSTRMKPFKIT